VSARDILSVMSSTLKALAIRGRPLFGGLLALVVIAIVFFIVLPSIAPWSKVWGTTQHLSWWWIAALVIAAALNTLTYAPPWMALMPGLSLRAALAVTLASTASTFVVPGGAFVGMGFQFAMLRGWGYRGRPVTLGLTIASLSNQLVIFGCPPLALAMLATGGGSDALLNTVAWVGLLVSGAIVAGLGASLYSEELAHGVGELAANLSSRALALVGRARVGWGGETFVHFRRDARELLGSRWHTVTLTTLANHLSMWLVLIISLRAVGVGSDQVTLIESFAAWSLVRVVGQIPIVPGGFGVIELGLTAALAGFGGDKAGVVATVVLYRMLTVVPPLLIGAAFAATWRRHHPSWNGDPTPSEAVSQA
jgi:uncharacterized membrane protein YbhN (UPF0104 family)